MNPNFLALASVAPDIASNVYTIIEEMLNNRGVIHDKKRPPGWIDVDSGTLSEKERWTHSLSGNVVLTLCLVTAAGLYYGNRKYPPRITPSTTPLVASSSSVDSTSADKAADKLARTDDHPSSAIAFENVDFAGSMMAVGIAVMSHIFLDTIGQTPAALLPAELLTSTLAIWKGQHSQGSHATQIVTYANLSPAWTLMIDFLLAMMATYMYCLDPFMTPKYRLRLATLTAVLMIVEGSLYLPRPLSLMTATSGGAKSALWSLVRQLCGALLVGVVLNSIPQNTSRSDIRSMREMLLRGMANLKGEIRAGGDLPRLPDSPPAVPIEATSGVPRSKGKRDSGFYDYDDPEQDKDTKIEGSVDKRGVKSYADVVRYPEG